MRRVYLGIEPARILAEEGTDELVIGVMPEDPVRLHLCFDRCEFSWRIMKGRPFESARLPVAQGVVLQIGVEQELAKFVELCVVSVV